MRVASRFRRSSNCFCCCSPRSRVSPSTVSSFFLIASILASSSSTRYSRKRTSFCTGASAVSGRFPAMWFCRKSTNCWLIHARSNHPLKLSSSSSAVLLSLKPLKALSACCLSLETSSNPASSSTKHFRTRLKVTSMKVSSAHRSLPFRLKSKHLKSRCCFSAMLVSDQRINAARTSKVSTFPSKSASRLSHTLIVFSLRFSIKSSNVRLRTTKVARFHLNVSMTSLAWAAVQNRRNATCS
mmetsp:Transcript_124/g.339  ORF Transcript_124/g.339 Transcript_124/m.339 type:complete len:241 (-) Transcript_124:59-781(-)